MTDAPTTPGSPLWVGVFRLQLFKPSETFITAQAGALVRYVPIFIGRRRFGLAPAGVEAAILAPGWAAALRLVLFRDVAGLVEALGGRRIDLLHAHFAVDAVYAQVLARRLGVPLVTTLHGFDVTRRRRSMLRSLRPALVHAVCGWRSLARDGELFLAVSDRVAEAARDRGVLTTRLRRHAIGVDVARMRPAGEGEAGLIVHVGRLVEKKGTADLIDAFAAIAHRRPDARLLLIGDGPLRARLQAQARRTGLADRISLLGGLAHEATLAWLARAAMVAVPSRIARNGDAEGLPTVLLEAAALARPIVASDAAGAEALDHEVSALVVPAGDVSRLAAALDRLLDDRGLARELGREARRRVVRDYDLARQTARLEDLYDDLIASAAQPEAAG